MVRTISDKYLQYKLAENYGIDVPRTVYINDYSKTDEIERKLEYPLFIKARDVNEWRKIFSGRNKGFVINDYKELREKLKSFNNYRIPLIIQELIVSTDDQNYKICVYISKEGNFKLVFTLRKIHQYPIHFGIGSSAESYKYPELENIGKKLFTSIGYRGVGSAEFKYDNKDSKLKLIELNPRYWQQNSLSDYCGMNFPVMDYLEATDQSPTIVDSFQENLKWINISLDFDSYLNYKKEGSITFRKWLKDLQGKKTISNFSWDDKIPFLKLLYRNTKKHVWSFIKKLTGI